MKKRRTTPRRRPAPQAMLRAEAEAQLQAFLKTVPLQPLSLPTVYVMTFRNC